MSRREVEAWVAGQVELAGRLELVHERPWGSVWRAPVRGGVVWVKVCAPVQAFEPRLTAVLASRWPGLLPEVLGACLAAARGCRRAPRVRCRP